MRQIQREVIRSEQVGMGIGLKVLFLIMKLIFLNGLVKVSRRNQLVRKNYHSEII